MDTTESNSFDKTPTTFLVKIWVADEDKGTWRGNITHLSSGQMQHIKILEEIAPFIASHLEQMGVRLGVWWKIRHWLKQLLKK